VLRLEGVGLSVVAPTQELLYARLSGVQARATQSKARRTLEAAVRHIQADNTLASATYPVCPPHECTALAGLKPRPRIDDHYKVECSTYLAAANNLHWHW